MKVIVQHRFISPMLICIEFKADFGPVVGYISAPACNRKITHH